MNDQALTLTLDECLTRAGEIPIDKFYTAPVLGQISDALLQTELEFEEPYTGNSIKTAISTLALEAQTQLLATSIEMLSDEEGVDMSEILANVDRSGGKIRPVIASLIAVLLFVSVIAYGVLVWNIAYETKALPSWEALIIPIGIPITIAWSYFGFPKAARKELLEAVIQRTPVGNALVKFGTKISRVKK